jgi:ubiquitin-conjugating enzyme E2 R
MKRDRIIRISKYSLEGFPFYTVNILIFRKQVALSKAEAEKDGVVVPTTIEDYIVKTKPPENNLELTDFYDDDYDLDNDDDDGDEDDENTPGNYDDDSGNGDES